MCKEFIDMLVSKMVKDEVNTIMCDTDVISIATKVENYYKKLVMDAVCTGYEENNRLNTALTRVTTNICDNVHPQMSENVSYDLLSEVGGTLKDEGLKIELSDSENASIYREYAMNKPEDKCHNFTLNDNSYGIRGRGRLNADGTFTVYKGSTMVTEANGKTSASTYANYLEKVRDIVRYNGKVYVFIEDFTFENHINATECLKGYCGVYKSYAAGPWTNGNGEGINVVSKRLKAKTEYIEETNDETYVLYKNRANLSARGKLYSTGTFKVLAGSEMRKGTEGSVTNARTEHIRRLIRDGFIELNEEETKYVFKKDCEFLSMNLALTRVMGTGSCGKWVIEDKGLKVNSVGLYDSDEETFEILDKFNGVLIDTEEIHEAAAI